MTGTGQDGTSTLCNIKSSSFSTKENNPTSPKIQGNSKSTSVVNSTYFNNRAYLNKGKNKKENRFLPPHDFHVIYSDALKSQ